jgi:hypothetical protein
MKAFYIFVILTLSSASLSAQVKEVNFTEQYKKDHNGKYKVEINEVKELILIMLSVTHISLPKA